MEAPTEEGEEAREASRPVYLDYVELFRHLFSRQTMLQGERKQVAWEREMDLRTRLYDAMMRQLLYIIARLDLGPAAPVPSHAHMRTHPTRTEVLCSART